MAAVEHTVVIVGSGFGGLAAARMLRELGVHDFLVLERRDLLGGTWVQNTYPGAQVDVQSPLYSLSWAPHPWSRMFALQEELQAYTERVIAEEGLADRARTGAEVEAARWDAEARRWVLQTSTGEVRARFVVNASGPLSNPIIPSFPGRERFAGPAFHTNHWDHSVDLRGKRVAVVGSGASAAQVIPALADTVAALHVFQRTPHWVLSRPDRVFSPWQRKILANRVAYALVRAWIYWRLEARVVAFKHATWILEHLVQRGALRHLEAQVPDPELRAALTPRYTIGCKRILLSDTLLPALGREHVRLHTAEDGIAEVNESGLRTAGGEQVDLDAIVWATGFDAVHGLVSYPVQGEGGRSLSEAWAEFPRAYLGTTVPGFPNYFVVTGPNTGIGHTSAVFVIEAQMAYIRRCIREVLPRPGGAIAVQAEAEARYTARIHRSMSGTVWQIGGCRSWYQSRSGEVIAMFPGFTATFWAWCRMFRRRDHRVLE